MDQTHRRKFTTVDEYLDALPEPHKSAIGKIRQVARAVAPEAEEIISYNMPAFRLHGILIYFAAHQNHIGFYPASLSVMRSFVAELTNYSTSKGTIQFRINEKLPIDLIKRIIEFRVTENIEKDQLKRKKKMEGTNR